MNIELASRILSFYIKRARKWNNEHAQGTQHYYLCSMYSDVGIPPITFNDSDEKPKYWKDHKRCFAPEKSPEFFTPELIEAAEYYAAWIKGPRYYETL